MFSTEFDISKTGWVEIPGGTKTIVAHHKDGHTEKMGLVNFVCLSRKAQKTIVRIDCYQEGETPEC